MLEHCKGDSFISLEGELSKLSLAKLEGSSSNETAALKRGTLWPKQDFIVLPVEQPKAVIAALGGSIPSSVVHIQLENDGNLVFGAYDHFQHLHFGELLDEGFLDRLVSDGILQRVN